MFLTLVKKSPISQQQLTQSGRQTPPLQVTVVRSPETMTLTLIILTGSLGAFSHAIWVFSWPLVYVLPFQHPALFVLYDRVILNKVNVRGSHIFYLCCWCTKTENVFIEICICVFFIELYFYWQLLLIMIIRNILPNVTLIKHYNSTHHYCVHEKTIFINYYGWWGHTLR